MEKERGRYLYLQHSSLLLPSHRSGSGSTNYRSLHVTLCKLVSVGERQHQNVPKSNPLGLDGLWKATAPDGEHLLTPDSLQSHNPDRRWRRVGQEPAGFPSCSGVRAEGAVATTQYWSTAESSVCPVLPLLVFLILLFVGTLGAEPLHLFWGCSRNPNARPRKDGKISYNFSGVTLLLFLTQRNETFQWETLIQINLSCISSN